jgi:DNA-binding HxlR family transcriptional regulator
MVSSQEVLNAISDEKSMNLFKTIAVSKSNNSTILNSKMKITRKQYYTRMKALAKAGLITRKNGIYFLTSFGKVLYNYQLDIETAVNYYWKLKALDSILISSSDNMKMPIEEQVKLANKLIDHYKIRDIIIPTIDTPVIAATDYYKQAQQYANVSAGPKQNLRLTAFS